MIQSREKEAREFLERWAPDDGEWKQRTASETARRYIFARMKHAEYKMALAMLRLHRAGQQFSGCAGSVPGAAAITPVDAWGVEIRPGDYVVYPVRTGSTVRMVKAHVATVSDTGVVRVTRLQEATKHRYDNVEPKVVALSHTGHVTVIHSRGLAATAAALREFE